MTPEALRLELVRLVHRFDHEPERVIDRAKALEAYVLSAQPIPRKGRRAEPSET